MDEREREAFEAWLDIITDGPLHTREDDWFASLRIAQASADLAVLEVGGHPSRLLRWNETAVLVFHSTFDLFTGKVALL